MPGLAPLLALACTPTPDGADEAPEDGDTASDSGTPPIEADIEAALGDCDGTYVAPAEYPNSLIEGDSLHVVVLDDAAGRCNDGTPPALYVRAGDGANASRWVFHLQGGGNCTSWQDCHDRWCGTGGYDASKMSSRFVPDSILGTGIHEDDPRSALADWNHVFAYYCSSDSWLGQALTTIPDPAGAGATYTIYRQGHTIIESMLDALDAGLTSKDGTQAMPPLADATDVLWTGTSAGSRGAQSHADWLADRLGEGVNMGSIFDASVVPDVAEVPDDVDSAIAAYYAGIADWQASVGEDVFVDESCAATLSEFDCALPGTILYGHISSPFFTRMDLYDSVALPQYRSLGMSDADFATAVRNSQLSLPASYSQACGQHVGIESSAWTYQATLTADSGAEVSVADAYTAWVGGRSEQLVDTIDGARSNCVTNEEE